MKIFIISIFILLTFSPFNNLYSQYTVWENISNRIPGDSLNNLSDVFLVHPSMGWISSSSHPEIYRTTDHGETWETQNMQTPISAIYFVWYNLGFAGGIDGDVFKTTDMGENWINIGSIGKPIRDISFIYDFHLNPIGYICGDDGALWAINDTILSDISSGLSVDFSAISSPQINKVWICGNSSIYFFDGNIITKQFTSSVLLNSVHMEPHYYNLGLTVGDSGYSAKTTDSGQTWIEVLNPDTLKRSLYDVYFVGTIGWAVGNQGVILRSTNHGTSWMIEETNLTSCRLGSVHISGSTGGFGPILAVGENKTALINPIVVSVDDEPITIDDFELFQNYPNPFNPTTIIKYQIPGLSYVTIKVFDVLGNEVATLVNDEKPAGSYEVGFDGSNLTSGIYFYQLRAGDYTETKKMILLR